MDDLDDLQASEFVTDTEDQDSLDERIDSEQRLRNQHLWASFQNAACCITRLYKDRAQPNISPWVPFQNAASNLTTLYKDCIESQKRFARIGYQVGRRRRSRDLAQLLKKHKQLPQATRHLHTTAEHGPNNEHCWQVVESCNSIAASDELASTGGGGGGHQQQNNFASSILGVNRLDLSGGEDCVQTALQPTQSTTQASTQQLSAPQSPLVVQHQSNLQPAINGNNEDELATFQLALAQPTPASRGIKVNQNNQRRSQLSPNSPSHLLGGGSHRTGGSPVGATRSEEDRLSELNQFLSEEYHKHVGSRKRTCSTLGGSSNKRLRD